MVSAASPALIGLDWGTTSLRAFLMRGGAVIEMRSSNTGMGTLGAAADFERAFASVARDWLEASPASPVVACGMVGSAQGWREAPYAHCPVDLRALASQGVTVASGIGADIVIVPGVRFDPPQGAPDVMRGEETQVLGALLHQPTWAERACIVLPGTHSKWVRVERGRIAGLATRMTGELFAVLKAHSILGRLMTTANADHADAFTQGLDDARGSGAADLLHALFAARTLGLAQRLPHDALADYLSGLLIGHELTAALGSVADAEPLVLVGEPALCARYASALRHLGHPADAVLGNTAPQGLWSLAEAAGLIG